MCGIIAILGQDDVAPRLVAGLKRLEYRGYDSAGIATLDQGRLARCRAEGKLCNLEARLRDTPLKGFAGIGHTRWATHGAPTERNAHPHQAGRVALVHNGIIENFRELRAELAADGIRLETDTDTEVVVQLINREREAGKSPEEAVRAVLSRLVGAYALAILFEGEEDLLIGARHGPPLVVGHGDGEMYLGSDAVALSKLTDRLTYLDDGDWVVLSRQGARIFNREGAPVQRPVKHLPQMAGYVDKGEFRHFMAKEIHEQPDVIGRTLGRYVDFAENRLKPLNLPFDLARLSRVTITACGTAYYAGLVAKYWFESLARLPVDIDVASEFRYREPPLPENGLTLLISQSGETADTLAALRYAKAVGQHVAGIVNVEGSSIDRESHVTLPTLAGTEIGVASTKAFTCQLAVLACLAIAAGRARGVLTEAEEKALIAALLEVPRHIADILVDETPYEALARYLSRARDVLYLGRGINFPLALEGALKLKEISYIHAEGYAAGELKHGPIALIEESVPVVVVAPRDSLFEKTISNMQEVAARQGKIILLTDAETEAVGCDVFQRLPMPTVPEITTPLVYAVPVQLIAYHTAVFMGTDVDQPRNLAKSVTVE